MGKGLRDAKAPEGKAGLWILGLELEDKVTGLHSRTEPPLSTQCSGPVGLG